MRKLKSLAPKRPAAISMVLAASSIPPACRLNASSVKNEGKMELFSGEKVAYKGLNGADQSHEGRENIPAGRRAARAGSLASAPESESLPWLPSRRAKQTTLPQPAAPAPTAGGGPCGRVKDYIRLRESLQAMPSQVFIRVITALVTSVWDVCAPRALYNTPYIMTTRQLRGMHTCLSLRQQRKRFRPSLEVLEVLEGVQRGFIGGADYSPVPSPCRRTTRTAPPLRWRGTPSRLWAARREGRPPPVGTAARAAPPRGGRRSCPLATRTPPRGRPRTEWTAAPGSRSCPTAASAPAYTLSYDACGMHVMHVMRVMRVTKRAAAPDSRSSPTAAS
eukprot:1178534-Prorocentrum_minimum.AAC.1